MNSLVPAKNDIEKLTKKMSLKVIKSDEFNDFYAGIEQTIAQLTEAKKAIDASVKDAMRKEYLYSGTQTIKTKDLTITFVPSGVRDTFDTTKFKEENPKVYEKYIKTSQTSEALRVKVNKKEGE